MYALMTSGIRSKPQAPGINDFSLYADKFILFSVNISLSLFFMPGVWPKLVSELIPKLRFHYISLHWVSDYRVSRNTGMTEKPECPCITKMTMVGVKKPECPCSRVNDDNLPGIPVFRHCKNKAKALDWCGPFSRSVNARVLGIPVLIENLFRFINKLN